MTPPEPLSVGIEELLGHSSWLRGLATRLVRDDATADDLVQQAWVAALKRPPEAERQRSWLGSVVHRLAARTHRDGFRRSARERLVARSESTETPEDVLVRAETQSWVAGDRASWR